MSVSVTGVVEVLRDGQGDDPTHIEKSRLWLLDSGSYLSGNTQLPVGGGVLPVDGSERLSGGQPSGVRPRHESSTTSVLTY